MTDTRIAVITGANRGIGFETARQLAQRGLIVVLTARDPNKAKEAAAKLQATGTVSGERLDVTDVDSCKALRDSLESRFGAIDILVNNAAIMPDAGRGVVERPMPVAEFQRVFDTNVFGMVRVTQALAPLMKRGGVIVNVSSGWGLLDGMEDGAGFAAYRASKATVNALTRLLAAELKRKGIRVNAVDPGWVRTDMGGRSAPRAVEEGAASVVAAALVPAKGPTGAFLRDGDDVGF